jgi:hypothetical protein
MRHREGLNECRVETNAMPVTGLSNHTYVDAGDAAPKCLHDVGMGAAPGSRVRGMLRWGSVTQHPTLRQTTDASRPAAGGR